MPTLPVTADKGRCFTRWPPPQRINLELALFRSVAMGQRMAMHPQAAWIKTHMEVISADGRRIGYVERITEVEIITLYPCRRILFSSIRRVTDAVYIAERYDELQESLFLTGPARPPEAEAERPAAGDRGRPDSA